MKTVIVGNEKGGTGKTTTATTIAGGLARRGFKVMLIDADAQGHATEVVGYFKEPGLFQLLASGNGWGEVTRVVPKEWYSGEDDSEGLLYLVPSDVSTIAIGEHLDEAIEVRRRLEQLQELVDYVIIDTSPTPAPFTASLLLAADFVIYTTLPERLSLDGLDESINRIQTIQEMRRNEGMHDLRVMGIQTTRMMSNTIVHRRAYQQLQRKYGEQYPVWPVIHQRVAWMEAQFFQEAIHIYDTDGKASAEAEALVDRVVEALSE